MRYSNYLKNRRKNVTEVRGKNLIPFKWSLVKTMGYIKNIFRKLGENFENYNNNKELRESGK